MIYFVPISAAESIRNEEAGTWFIEALCDQLDNRTENCRDLLELMTKVTDVVVQIPQENKDEVTKETKYFAQTPEIVSFLHRRVILP